MNVTQRDTVIISYLTYFEPLWVALTMLGPNQTSFVTLRGFLNGAPNLQGPILT